MAQSGVSRKRRSARANTVAVAAKVMNNGTITDKGGQKSTKPSGKPKSMNE